MGNCPCPSLWQELEIEVKFPLVTGAAPLSGCGAPYEAGETRGPPVTPSGWLSLSDPFVWHRVEVLDGDNGGDWHNRGRLFGGVGGIELGLGEKGSLNRQGKEGIPGP